MADILRSLGSSQEGVKRAAETAFRQTSDEIDRVEAELTALVTSTSASAAALEAEITALEVRAAALEGRATSLESRATALEGRATSLEGRATTLEGDVSALESAMTAVEGRATSLETRMNGAEAKLWFFTFGTGAPSADADNGTIYLRLDGTTASNCLYSRVGGAWVAILGAT